MKDFRRNATLALALAAFSAPLAAHELERVVEHASAVVVRLSYGGAAPFSYESYEVFRDGEKTPFQVGRTDAHGRLAFVPDRSGAWRVKAVSADGHGADFTVDTASAPDAAARPFFDRHARLVAGAGFLFGLFGLWSLFGRRRGGS